MVQKTSNDFFRKLIKISKFYLEYGAGSSTLLAKKLNKKFVSIETDKSFFSYIKKKEELIKLFIQISVQQNIIQYQYSLQF